MAAAARPHNLLLSLILSLYLLMSVNALYLPSAGVGMVARKVVVSTQPDGNVTVVDSDTRAAVPQGPASDGSTSPAAVIWMGFCFVVGAPMAAAGIRGWRLTTGVGVGVSAGVLSWAAIVNSVNEEGLPDLILTAVVMAFSFMGFVLGIFEFARIGAMVLLCVNGGLAFGLRVALVKEGLLIDDSGLFFLNWLVVGAFGGMVAVTMIWHQRAMLLFACASIGTFLVFLGVDLLMNKEDGLSRGLRFIFDRNSSHLVDILSNGYRPALSTRINVYVSLGVTPVFAYAQHRLFRAPFRRGPPPPSDAELSLNYPTNVTANRISGYLSGIWDRKKFQDASPNRFSL